MAIIKLSSSERRRLSAFVTCLGLAILAWVFVKLSDTYNYSVKQVLTFRNAPYKRAFMPLQSDTVGVTIQGTGWEMLFAGMNKLKPIEIDLQGLNHSDFVVLNSQLNRVNTQVKRSHRIIDFNPDTLYFDFTKQLIKKIPVNPQFKINYVPRYAMAGNLVVNPAYVTINGPADIISTINSWKTDSLKRKNVNRSFNATLNLLPVKTAGINVYPKTVQVSLPVEEFTEKTLELPVKLVNNPNYYTVKVFPQKVRVTVSVPLSAYAGIDEQDFTLQADLDFWQQGYTELPVKVVKQPQWCRIISMEHHTVDFIIKK